MRNLLKTAIVVTAAVGMLLYFLPVTTAQSTAPSASAPAAQAQNYLSFKTDDEANNIEIFRKVSPSVVFVTNSALYRTSLFSFNVQEMPQGTGTGFIWDKSGLIVTNFHVVQDADRVTITLHDQTSYDAKVLGVAPDKDLALLKIDAPKEDLQAIPLGDSSQLEVGRKVLAIGNPFGLDTTLTVGVVSALGREIDSLTNRKIRGVIQTDASINPGNSGGPLLNSLGQLVGITAQIVSPSGASAGIGFAIPVNMVKKVVPQLLNFGHEIRPDIGIRELPDNYGRAWGIKGVAVLDVNRGSPAARAGIKGMTQDRRGRYILGDIIVEVDGITIKNDDDYQNALEQHQPGETIKVVTLRDDKKMEFNLTLQSGEAI